MGRLLAIERLDHPDDSDTVVHFRYGLRGTPPESWSQLRHERSVTGWRIHPVPGHELHPASDPLYPTASLVVRQVLSLRASQSGPILYDLDQHRIRALPERRPRRFLRRLPAARPTPKSTAVEAALEPAAEH